MKPSKPLLQIQPSFKNLFIFQFFFFVMHELHELAHIITGRMLCGNWGTRDFNVWSLCDTCKTAHPQIATFAGPLFTFVMLWLGSYWLTYGRTSTIRSLALVFIFGNMPFGRLYMAAMGSGDELFGLGSLFINADHSNLWLIRLAGFLIVALFCIPPIIMAYKAIAGKNKLLIFISLLIIPLILDTIILLILLNGLLSKGILSQIFLMGTPLLVTLWFAGCLSIVLPNYKSLLNFAIIKPAKPLPGTPVS